MSDLVDHLSEEQATCLPAAVGQVLPLLRNDPDRLHFAAHLAVRLDLFEVAAHLVELALAVDDRELKLAAATLCGNPAVEQKVRQRVAEAVAGIPFGRIRLDRSFVPRTEEEQRLYLQCWPGAYVGSSSMPQAPVVVLDNRGTADAALRFAVRLDRAGASLRRLSVADDIPPWFGTKTVLVCQATTRSRVLSAYPRFPERQILVEDFPTTDRETTVLLHRINTALSGQHQLKLGALGPEVESVLWEPDVFTAGVYATKDAAFLAGAKTSAFYRFNKKGFLRPRNTGVNLWQFRNVVAVRTWVYLQSMTSKRVSGNVVKALADFTGDAKAVKLGATSDGRVLVDQGDGWDDVMSGQRVLDIPITDIDAVFSPFEYGGGTALDLLQASENTRLHPTILNGTPHLEGHRISAKALASVDSRCRREAIEVAYPELAGKAFEDTLVVGKQLLSAI